MARKAKTAKQAPISAHPVFPAIVALWFAALFGIGSLVLPVVLFEKAVTATGLASLSSAMQPPLGPTARIAIAVASALIGVALGMFLARKVAASQVATPRPSRNARSAEPRAKKPISAMEELGAEGLDEPITDRSAPSPDAIPGRRRALAVTDDSGPSEYLEMAPLPGGTGTAADSNTDVSVSHGADDNQEEALELGDFEESEDRGWTEENARQSESFGSGSLSMASGARFDQSAAAATAQHGDPSADASRQFDNPTAPQPTAHPAPFAPPPSSPPVPTGAGAARPFDAPPQGGFPTFAEQQPAPPPFSQPLETEEADASEDDTAESPIDELRRHFDAPAPDAPSTAVDFAAAVEQAPAQTYNPMADRMEQAGTDRTRPAFGMPQPVAEQPVEQPMGEEASRPFAMPVEQRSAPQEQTSFAQPQASVAEPAEMPAASTAGTNFAEPIPASEPVAEETPSRPRFEAAALAELGMVELVERFALSLQRKQSVGDTSVLAQAARELMASSEPKGEPVPEPAPEAVPEPVEKPTVPAHMLPGASTQPPAPSIPHALQPIGFDDSDDGELEEDGFVLPFQRQPAPFARPQDAQQVEPAFAQDETDEGVEGDEDDQTPAQGFGSLLAMKSPFAGGREFVRIEDETDRERPQGDIEPVVVFPGNEVRRAAPASDGPSRDPSTAPRFEKRIDNGATEQALRDALAKLQKMSGAA